MYSLSLPYYGFGAYSSICGLRHEAEDADNGDEFEVEAVYEALSKVVAPDDAIIITEIGYEKLRYIVACHPRWVDGTLVWAQGAYFPIVLILDGLTASAKALRAAVDSLMHY